MNPRFPAVILGALTASAANAQWTQVTPASSPAARSGHAMAADPFSNTLLLFGGGGLFSLYADTWIYDGVNWTQLSPVTSPTSKFFTGLVYDWSRAVFVMYGGNATYSSPGVSETWEFDGTTWTQQFPVTNPGNLGGHAMAFDWPRSKTVLYGGIKTVGPIVDSNETWEYDGTNWVNRNPATNPGRLEHHSVCFHGGVGKTILFGGVNANPSTPPGSVANDKTWAYDGAANTWTELTIVGPRPNARERGTMAYDSVRDVCVLTGGLKALTGLTENGTWELRFDGANWTWTLQENPASGGRLNSGMAFLPIDRHMVKFGGTSASGGSIFAETKEWGAQNGIVGVGCAGTNGVPTLAATDAPRLGLPYTLNVTNLNVSLNFAILVFGFTPLPGIDLGPLLGMPGCLAYQTADILLSAPAGAAGATSWIWNPVTGNLGDKFWCQALSLDPPANAFGFTISNAVSATIGL